MPDEQDKPKVDLVQDGIHMRVKCGEADFAQVKKAICEAIGYGENVDRVAFIGLVNEDRKPKARQPGARDRILGAGCFIMAALVVVVFISGLVSIGDLFGVTNNIWTWIATCTAVTATAIAIGAVLKHRATKSN